MKKSNDSRGTLHHGVSSYVELGVSEQLDARFHYLINNSTGYAVPRFAPVERWLYLFFSFKHIMKRVTKSIAYTEQDLVLLGKLCLHPVRLFSSQSALI